MAFCGVLAFAAEPVATKPNIVLIVADDLGYGDLSCYGSVRDRTPHIDRLAAEGLRFTDFHSNGTMCSPTRAALLTGRYQNRFGPQFEGPLSARANDRGLPPGVGSLAAAMKQAGYATAMYGKWHLGFHAPFLPSRHGFDEFRGLLTGDGDHHSHIDRSGKEDWWHDEKIEMESAYTAELITRHSVDFIERHRDEAFFLYAAHLAIHFPWQGPGEKRHRIEGRNYWNLTKLGPHAEGKVAPVLRRMIGAVDTSVGKIVGALRRLGLERRTLVFFTSDNGGYLHYGNRFRGEVSSNGPLRGQKGDVFEGGHRVPAIAWWPGRIEGGRVSGETTMTMDLMPTFLELAAGTSGRDPGVELDGRSVRPLLLENRTSPTRTLFWRDGDERAVRRGRWKLVMLGTRTMLFDLAADLSERYNRAPQHPELVEELRSACELWKKDVTSGWSQAR